MEKPKNIAAGLTGKSDFKITDEAQMKDAWGMETPAHVSSKAAKLSENNYKARKKENVEGDDLGWGNEADLFSQKPASFSLAGSSYYNAPAGAAITLMDSRPTKINGEKCFCIVLGHASLKHGKCDSTMDPKSCASLKCTNCDKKVHRFLNGVWDPSVDYMFVRNFATNT